MNGDRSYTGAAGKISNHCFLKIETEGAKTRKCWKCVPIFHYPDRQGTAPSSKTAWSLQ